jgi:uncharacterized protein YjbI with pentapeptide repeats
VPNLVGALLTDADLTNANLDDADLSNANFIGANFAGVDLSSTKGVNWESLLKQAKIDGSTKLLPEIENPRNAKREM